MPEFRYTVVDAKGQTLNGVIDAENMDICRKIIAQRGLFCLNIAPVSIASRSISFGSKQKIKTKDLAVFCRQFATMLNSGIGIIKTLDILQTQVENKKFQEILKSVYESVQRGQLLSSAMKSQNGAFPDLLVNMIESGETGGTLDSVMLKMAEYFEKSLKTGNKVKNAMMYPLILGILTVAVVTILMVFVLPVFIEMFESSGAELPLPTKILIAISSSLTSYWYIYLIVISTLSIIFMNILKNEKGRLAFDRFKTIIPVVGNLNVIVISARFASTLSTMIQSGIPLLRALDLASKVMGNKFYESKALEIREDIKKGIPFSNSLQKTGVFPVMLTSMISIGEESGSLDSVLAKTAAFYDEEADSAVAKMVGIMEPAIIVIMAGIIGFIVVSIMLPMYGMMTNIG